MNTDAITFVSLVTALLSTGLYVSLRDKYPYDSKGFQALYSLFAGFIASLLILGVLVWVLNMFE